MACIVARVSASIRARVYSSSASTGENERRVQAHTATPMAAATTCGNDGTCNGAGACRKYVIGTQCAAATCTGSTSTSLRACDGAGVCVEAIK